MRPGKPARKLAKNILHKRAITLFHANVNELETLYNEVLYVNISFNT